MLNVCAMCWPLSQTWCPLKFIFICMFYFDKIIPFHFRSNFSIPTCQCSFQNQPVFKSLLHNFHLSHYTWVLPKHLNATEVDYVSMNLWFDSGSAGLTSFPPPPPKKNWQAHPFPHRMHGYKSWMKSMVSYRVAFRL